MLLDPNKRNIDTKMPTLRGCRLMWLHTPLRSAYVGRGVLATQRKTKRKRMSAAVLVVVKKRGRGGGAK